MKHITIEELENRKKILFDRRKKIEKQLEKDDKDKKFKLTMAFNSSLLHDIDCIIGEISFLIDYCNMKEDNSFKVTHCINCNKYENCKARKDLSVQLRDGLGSCVWFEEKGKIDVRKARSE